MKFSDVKIDMKVRFHPIIGGKYDGGTYTVRGTGIICGQEVAWLDKKAGCVSVRALSPVLPGIVDNYGLGKDGP